MEKWSRTAAAATAFDLRFLALWAKLVAHFLLSFTFFYVG